MRLALFDLDNTLLGGDSDHAWGDYLCERGFLDAVAYKARNDEFYQDYLAGKLQERYGWTKEKAQQELRDFSDKL